MAVPHRGTYFADSGTGWFVGIIVALALLAIGYLVFSAQPAPTLPLTSIVTVHQEADHGSGVHIGDGMILSASHVAMEGDAVTIETSDGKQRDATVVWASSAYDVAVLQTNPDGMAASPLSCASPVVGQQVTAFGSPMDFGQLVTHGAIVGRARPVERWTAAVPVDMVILPGMSGGPILNQQGEVVGLAVGIMAYPTLAGPTVTGIGFAVPSSVVCQLLGRT